MADQDEYMELAKQLAEKEKKTQPEAPNEQIGAFKEKIEISNKKSHSTKQIGRLNNGKIRSRPKQSIRNF